MAITHQARANSKVPHLCARLRELAIEKGPYGKLPTVNELCELLGTSRVTLNEVLNELEAQNIIYRQHSKGIFVSPKLHRKTICILFNSRFLIKGGASPFWGTLWGLLAQEAQKRAGPSNEYYRFHMILGEAEEAHTLPEEVIDSIKLSQIHGIIAIGVNTRFNTWINRYQIPCVTYAAAGLWVVGQETAKLLMLGVQHLAGQGCERIEVWRQIGDEPYMEPNMYSAFSYLLSAYQLFCEPEQIKDARPYLSKEDNPETISLQEQGYQLAKAVFSDPKSSKKPDGILIMNDMMTDGVLTALQGLAVCLEEDVKVVTHANVGSMLLFDHFKGLTVFEYDPAEIVQALFTLLDKLLPGKPIPEVIVNVSPRLRPRRDA